MQFLLQFLLLITQYWMRSTIWSSGSIPKTLKYGTFVKKNEIVLRHRHEKLFRVETCCFDEIKCFCLLSVRLEWFDIRTAFVPIVYGIESFNRRL
jgi:hypothetical protein